MTSQIFWITNGVNSDDEYRVITKSSEKIRCNHCNNKREGFVYVDKCFGFPYAICNNCIYNPISGLVNNLFIAISKRKNPQKFEKFLTECENKNAYLEVLN